MNVPSSKNDATQKVLVGDSNGGEDLSAKLKIKLPLSEYTGTAKSVKDFEEYRNE